MKGAGAVTIHQNGDNIASDSQVGQDVVGIEFRCGEF
jgi:hypothetical protein